MADHEATTEEIAVDPDRISPKVIASLAVGLLLTAAAAFLLAVGPEQLADLGPWAIPVGMGVTALGQALTAFLRRDPARTGITPADLERVAEQATREAGTLPAIVRDARLEQQPTGPVGDLAYRPPAP